MKRKRVPVEKIRNYIRKKKVERYLKQIDRRYYDTFQNCFSLFPPSFYLTHTPEEIKQITNETIERIQKLIEELE